MKAVDIIEIARDYKRLWHTNNPYEIADRLGIQVLRTGSAVKDFTAHTIKMAGYPTIITINARYSEEAARVLCAHELGHALLHGAGVNHFAITEANVSTSVEYEANLFAVALLSDDAIDSQLSVPLARMNNYLLKTILDYNMR